MSHKSWNVVTSMVVGVALAVGYALVAVDRYADGASLTSLSLWAPIMLGFLGLVVVAMIVAQILFRIGLSVVIAARGPESENVERVVASSLAEDEMDRLIALTAARTGYVLCGVGFVAMLVALAFGVAPVLALHIQLGGFVLGALASGAVSIHGYERGLRRG